MFLVAVSMSRDFDPTVSADPVCLCNEARKQPEGKYL